MNRKFAGAVTTFALVVFSLSFAGARLLSAQGVVENRTDSSIAAAATGVAQAVPVEHQAGGEANLIIPDLSQVSFLGGIHGRSLLMSGLVVCVLGLLFGLVFYSQLKKMAVHGSMLEISELIYETCKTYLITQGKFILILEVFIGFVILLYFGFLLKFEPMKVAIILLFSPGDYAGPFFIGFAIGESLGAAALRIAGGIFTKIADIGADLMKIVFN